MSDTNPIFRTLRESAGIRLALLFGAFFIFLLITSILSVFINSLPVGDARDHALIASVIQCLLAFCLPAIILAYFCSDKPAGWLYLTPNINFKALAGIVIVYIISLPAMEWLIEWNNNIHFPASMESLEKTFRSWEESNGKIAEILLDAHGIIPVITGVLIIGVLTGFSEELFFRGGLQGIFSRTYIGASASIWLAAFIFSMMHFQFFGFFPRLIMGVFFGYLLFWTKDIKCSVFAHALNNSIVVIASGLGFNDNLTTSETTFMPEIPYLPLYSLGLTILFFVCFRSFFFKKEYKSSDIWQKRQLPPVSGR